MMQQLRVTCFPIWWRWDMAYVYKRYIDWGSLMDILQTKQRVNWKCRTINS